MKIVITAKPHAKVNRVERIDDTHFRVFVKAPPRDGKANEAVLKALGEYFHLPKSRLSLVRGGASTTKVVELL